MRLFKYLSEERLTYLDNQLLRFSQPEAFNDPFELKPVIHQLLSDNYVKNNLPSLFEKVIEESFQELPVQFKSKVVFEMFRNTAISKLPQFVDFTKQLPPILEKSLNKLNEKVGIFCLTEEPTNLLMWAHYANSHQGYVIEFDASDSFFKNKDNKSKLIKVQYKDERPLITMSEEKNLDNFLAKSIEWEYEHEWRVIFQLSEANKVIDDIYLFKVPFLAIKSIILGSRASKGTKDKVFSFKYSTKGNHIKVFQAEIDDKEFKLNLLEMAL